MLKSTIRLHELSVSYVVFCMTSEIRSAKYFFKALFCKFCSQFKFLPPRKTFTNIDINFKIQLPEYIPRVQNLVKLG